jgi:hypothetical protein
MSNSDAKRLNSENQNLSKLYTYLVYNTRLCISQKTEILSITKTSYLKQNDETHTVSSDSRHVPEVWLKNTVC